MRDHFLPFALPDMDEAEVAAAAEVIRSGWLTTGGKVRAFETAFAERVGARHAIAVNSCTAALHLALEAVGVRQGDRVVTTPYTFATSGEVIRYLGAHPVFVDVRPDTLNIDPEQVAAALARERIAAIIPVHIAGEPCELDALRAIAGRDADRLEREVERRGARAHRDRVPGADPLGERGLERADLGAGGQPARADHLGHRGDLGLVHVGQREREEVIAHGELSCGSRR